MYTCSEEAEKIIDDVRKELLEACYVWPPFESVYHGHRILDYQIEQFQAQVFKKPQWRNDMAIRREAIQIAAMAIRFIFDLCDKPKTECAS